MKVYQKLANVCRAIERCKVKISTEKDIKVIEHWENVLSEHQAKLQDILSNSLPQGSGFNYDIELTKCTDTQLVFVSDYDLMDEYGYYDGRLPFRIVVNSVLTGIDIKITCFNTYIPVRHSGIKDYIAETYYDYLMEEYNEDKK